MQAVADLLLLTNDLRPVTTESLSVFGQSYSKCKDTIIDRTKGLQVLTGKIHEQINNIASKWQDICMCLQEICNLVVGLTECCAHAAYLIAVEKYECQAAVMGITDLYKISKARADIDLGCSRLNNLQVEDITPAVLVQIGQDLNMHLTGNK